MIYPEYIPKEKTVRIAQEICLKLLEELDDICVKNKITYWIDGGTLLGAVRHQGFIPWDDDIDVCFSMDDYSRLLEVLNDYCDSNPDRLLYFKNTRFKYLTDFYGSTEYLVDGIFPIKIDLIPVKLIENTEKSLNTDNSINQVCSIFLVGKAKESLKIIPEHQSLINFKNGIMHAKSNFIKFYCSYMLNNIKYKNDTLSLAAYCYHDAFMQKKRPYHTTKSIFPVQKVLFESRQFYAPNIPHDYLTVLYGSDYLTLPPVEKQKTHISSFYKNENITKEDLKLFIERFQLLGDFNLAINYKKRGIRIKIRRIMSVMYLFFVLFLKINLLVGFCRYLYIHSKRF